MKKNMLLLGLLIILGLLAWWVVDRQSANTTLSSYEGSFAIPDTAMIGKVTMLDRTGKKITVERQEGYWMLNERFVAEQTAIRELLRTLSSLEVKFIPPKSMVDNVLKSLGTHGRRVDIWDTRGNLLKTYYVGGVTPDGLGTYFLMEGSNKPFVVTMKYFVGSVSVRFHLDEKDWRDLSLLPLSGKTVRRLAIEYPRQRDKSFVIERKGSSFQVDPFFELTERQAGKVDQDIVDTYLRDIRKLKIEGFVNEHPGRDSISRQLPFCRIQILTEDSTDLSLAFHPMITTDRKGTILTDADGKPLPVERYHVSTNWGDFMTAQNQPFKGLFATYELFFR